MKGTYLLSAGMALKGPFISSSGSKGTQRLSNLLGGMGEPHTGTKSPTSQTGTTTIYLLLWQLIMGGIMWGMFATTLRWGLHIICIPCLFRPA